MATRGQRTKRRVWRVIAFSGLVLFLAQVMWWLSGPFHGGRFDYWECRHCGGTLLHWPDNGWAVITLSRAYDGAPHVWHRMDGTELKPWTWLDVVVRWPDPSTLLSRAIPSARCNRGGLISAFVLEEDRLSATIGREFARSGGMDLSIEELQGLADVLACVDSQRVRRALDRLGAINGRSLEDVRDLTHTVRDRDLPSTQP